MKDDVVRSNDRIQLMSKFSRPPTGIMHKAIACAMLLFVVVLVGTAPAVMADENAERFLQRDSVREYIHDLSVEHQLNPNRISGLFAKLKRQQKILDAISRPAERTLTWREYRPIFITDKRIDGGVEFLEQHNELLKRAEDRFGVPAEIITAIIGVETFYGRITGSYGVLEALATLAFDYPPRSAFFSSEMTEFILLGEAEGWDTVNIKGSYAGAMGMPQFIASSYREYAIDFDGDGKRDLFENTADIIGSVANYLGRHGWVEDGPIAEPWNPDNGISSQIKTLVSDTLKPDVSAGRVQALGFDSDSLAIGTSDNKQLSVMALNGEQGEELWIGYANFYAITRYNHSHLYAMAVYQLADAIGSASQ